MKLAINTKLAALAGFLDTAGKISFIGIIGCGWNIWFVGQANSVQIPHIEYLPSKQDCRTVGTTITAIPCNQNGSNCRDLASPDVLNTLSIDALCNTFLAA